mgnify:CR=1 FL=1
MVALGKVTDPVFLVGLISIVATVVLSSMNVKGALLWASSSLPSSAFRSA